MINHIPAIGAKRMMVYMAMENMKPIDKTNTLLDQTMKAKYARSVAATVERSEFNTFKALISSERFNRQRIINFSA
tara:strand:+ start:186 stop:413 length:228 start_codon:yes stop_codon:yes gene_type:complete